MLGVYGRSSRSSRHGDDRGARGRSISFDNICYI